MQDAYVEGFIQKCAELGVDPEALVKQSAVRVPKALTRVNYPRLEALIAKLRAPGQSKLKLNDVDRSARSADYLMSNVQQGTPKAWAGLHRGVRKGVLESDTVPTRIKDMGQTRDQLAGEARKLRKADSGSAKSATAKRAQDADTVNPRSVKDNPGFHAEYLASQQKTNVRPVKPPVKVPVKR